jgi:hypothetical protein
MSPGWTHLTRRGLTDVHAGPPRYSVFVLGMVWSFRRHHMRRNLCERGRRLKGPQIITVKEFNRWSGANGIGFSTTTRGEMVCIPRSFESSHLMIMGDSGTGKSALQRQLLMQIMERRETTIVYDPALEYTPQFYRPELDSAFFHHAEFSIERRYFGAQNLSFGSP